MRFETENIENIQNSNPFNKLASRGEEKKLAHASPEWINDNNNWTTHMYKYLFITYACVIPRSIEVCKCVIQRYLDVIYILVCLNSFIRQRWWMTTVAAAAVAATIVRRSSDDGNVKSFILLLGRAPWHWLTHSHSFKSTHTKKIAQRDKHTTHFTTISPFCRHPFTFSEWNL